MKTDRNNFHRVNVIGTSGSGKSTFARKLAEVTGSPYVEMDLLFWNPNWEESSDEVFFARLSQALSQPRWVLDGNYNRTQSIKWQNVTAIVWVDYSFQRTLYQAVRRTVTRIISQKELWPGTGNRESLRLLFSKDSIVLWTLKTYDKMKTRYEELQNDPKYKHIHFVRLRCPKEAQEFLTLLAQNRQN